MEKTTAVRDKAELDPVGCGSTPQAQAMGDVGA